MPPFEITLITRPLPKKQLVDVLHRVTSGIFDKGAVVTRLDSMGHRDLAFRCRVKQSKEHVYASNHFLVSCHMSWDAALKVNTALRNDLDVMRFGLIDKNHEVEAPTECKLEEQLKPPAYRQSVADLRANQKLGHFPRQRMYKRTEKEWRSVPKSYPIAQEKS